MYFYLLMNKDFIIIIIIIIIIIKLSLASLRLRFSLTRKVKNSPPHEMVLSTQALYTMTLVCSVSLLLTLSG